MKNEMQKEHKLYYEEMEEVKEFSLGGLSIGAIVVTGLVVIAKLLMQLQLYYDKARQKGR